VSRSAADRLVRQGRWTRPASSVYCAGLGPLDPLGLAHLGRAYGGSTALVTGTLAASALGLRWVPPATAASILVPGPRRLRSHPLVQVRRSHRLADLPRLRLDDIAYAGPTRAVLDCGLTLPTLRDVRGVVLAAVADRRTTIADLEGLLQHEPRNGTALLRRALSDAARGCASPPEAELVDALVGCGLPFLVNPEIRVAGRFVGCPDVWLVGLGTGGEMDSRERHDEDGAFDATLARHDRFGAHGLQLCHLTPRRFRRDPGGRGRTHGHGPAAARAPASTAGAGRAAGARPRPPPPVIDGAIRALWPRIRVESAPMAPWITRSARPLPRSCAAASPRWSGPRRRSAA
jgi:hypothetical protein